ncbi:MAG: hypothetical protein WDL87_07735 [Candidatus Omnitrophota bacterium]
MFRRTISIFLVACFLFQQVGFAQVASEINIAGYLSQIRTSIAPDKFRPMHLRYFSYDNQNNNFKLLVDRGDAKDLKGDQLETSSRQLLSYFLVGVTLPNENFWVNLRPDREDQIIDDALGTTDVGKIMLEADLQLKKDTAKFTSPETAEGKEYWDKLYQKAGELFGADNVTIPTLTRPWIVPSEVIIREGSGSAYVYKATLKVMLEQDHIKNSEMYNFSDEKAKALNEYSSELIRQIIIPKLTKEVNISKRYASLRQVFYSLVLSRWFKERFSGQSGLYASLIDQKNLAGLTSQENWSKSVYFQAYKKSFQDGEYNIAKQVHTPTGQVIRTYFSGGIALQESLPNVQTAGSPIGTFSSPNAELPKLLINRGQIVISGHEGQGNDPLGGAYAVNDNSAGSPVRIDDQEKKDIPSASPIDAQVSTDKLTWKEAFNIAGFYRPLTAWRLMKFDNQSDAFLNDDLLFQVAYFLMPRINKPEAAAVLKRWIERGESIKSLLVIHRISDSEQIAYEQIGAEPYQRMLVEAVESGNEVLQRKAAIDVYLPDELKRALFEKGKEYLIGNKSGLPIDLQEKIALSDNASLKQQLAYQEYTHPDVLSLLAKDEDEEVLRAVAFHEKTKPADLQSLVGKHSNRIASALIHNKAVGYSLFQEWLKEEQEIRRQKTLEERAKMLTAYEAKIKERGEPSRAEITVYAEGDWSEYKQFVLPLAPLHNIAGIAGLIPHKKAVKFVIEGAKPDIENFVEALRKWAVIQDIEVKWGEYKKEFFVFGIVEKSRRQYYYSDESGSRVIDDSWGLGDYVLAGLVLYTLFGQDNETTTESNISPAVGGFEFDSPEDKPQSSVHETEETSSWEAPEPSGSNDSSSPITAHQEIAKSLEQTGITYSYLEGITRFKGRPPFDLGKPIDVGERHYWVKLNRTLLGDFKIVIEGFKEDFFKNGMHLEKYLTIKVTEDGISVTGSLQLSIKELDKFVADIKQSVSVMDTPVASTRELEESLTQAGLTYGYLDKINKNKGALPEGEYGNVKLFSWAGYIMPYLIRVKAGGILNNNFVIRVGQMTSSAGWIIDMFDFAECFTITVHRDGRLVVSGNVHPPDAVDFAADMMKVLKDFNSSSSAIAANQKSGQSFLSSVGTNLTYYWLRVKLFREYQRFEKEYGFNKNQLETIFTRLAQKPNAKEVVAQLMRFAYYASVAGFLDEQRMLYYTALDDWDADGYADGPHYALDKNILHAIANELTVAQDQGSIIQRMIAIDNENKEAKLNVTERQNLVLNVLKQRVTYEVIKARLESVPSSEFFAETNKLREEGVLPKDSDVESWNALNALAYEDPTLTTAMGRFLDDNRHSAEQIAKESKGESGVSPVSASSAMKEETKDVPGTPGGIDFRVMDIKYQPLGLFKGLNYTLPILNQAELDKINLDEEIKQIQIMVESGIIPSGRRIKELVAASSQKGELNKRMNDLLLCLVDICRLEEENVSESAPELREALVILDTVG